MSEHGSSASSKPASAAGSQTLLRGLDLLEAVTRDPVALPELSRRLNLNRSTVHRLASALVDRGYLRFVPRTGYMLGAKLLELGFAAREQIDIPRIARPHLEALAEWSEDTVHLGILDGGKALYLDKISGRRRIEISSRIGERQPLCSTGLGKALILDMPIAELRAIYEAETKLHPSGEDWAGWSKRMKDYSANGYSFDLEENEDRIRCVGAPIRDETGAIVGAISLSSVAQYMDDARMHALVADVRATADAISRDIGWSPDQAKAKSKT